MPASKKFGLLPDGAAPSDQQPSACDPSRTELDWFNECAREIGKLPQDWQWFKLEAIGKYPKTQGVMVTGAISPVLIAKGPRKGEPNFKLRDRSTEQQVFVSHEAIDARKAKYELETGVCHRCFGDGKVVHSVSVDAGVTYRKCRRCDGTGKAPAQGMEAGTAETEGLGAKPDSPFAESGAPEDHPRSPLAEAPSTGDQR